jgi:hypothetical protein
LAAGSVENAKLASGAVTAAKIGSGAVETDKLADDAVTTAKLADDAVTTAKLDDGAVTAAKSSLTAADVGAYADTNPSSFVDAAGASAAAPVQSVDSLTGAVDLVPRYAVASDSAPVSPFAGQRWVQTSTGRLAYWTGSEWVEIGALGLDLSVAAADPAFVQKYAEQWRGITTRSYGAVGNTTTSPTLNLLVFAPVYFPAPTTVDAVLVEVTTAGNAGSIIRLGIYDQDSNGNPGDLLVDAGTADGATVGVQALTITPTVFSGMLFAAAVVQVESTTLRAATAANHVYFGGVHNTTLNVRTMRARSGESGGLPATANATTNLNTGPVVHLRVA